MLYGGEAQLQGVWVRASWGERSTTPLDKLEDNTIEQHNTGDWHHTTGAKVGWITAFLLAHVSRCRSKNDYVKKKKVSVVLVPYLYLYDLVQWGTYLCSSSGGGSSWPEPPWRR